AIVAVEAVRETAQPAFAGVFAVPRGHEQASRLELNHRVAGTAAVTLRPAFRPCRAASAARGTSIVGLALALIPLRIRDLPVNGNRPLPRRATVGAGEIIELLLVAQEEKPELSARAVESRGEVGA